MKIKKNVTDNTLVVKFDGRLKKLVSELVYKDDYSGWYGVPKIADYIEEIWRYMNYNTSNKKKYLFFGKDLRSGYETSDDLKSVAWVKAHANMINLKVPDNFWDSLIPTTAEGIAIWDSTLVDITDIPYRLIHDAILDPITKRWYGESSGVLFPTIVEYEPPFKESKPVNKAETKEPTKEKKLEKEAPKATGDILAEAEHPEEDEIITDDHDKMIFGPQFGYVRSTSELKTFGETMKNSVIFEKNNDENIIDTNTDYPAVMGLDIETSISNAVFEGQYPPLEKFTKQLLTKGLNVCYKFYQIPAGYLISTAILDGYRNNEIISNVFIDPNVLYRNGYNVLTCTHNGDIVNELVCKITDVKTVIRFVKGPSLTKKERKAILEKHPFGTRDVIRMIDLSGLGFKEPLSNAEWTKLMTNLYKVIKSGAVKYRSKLVSLIDPGKFTLLQDNNVLPLLPFGIGKDPSSITKPVNEFAKTITYDESSEEPNKVTIMQLTNQF